MANGKLRRPMQTLGMQMRNFGRNLMRFYFGSRQAADQPPALPPPSWQRHTDTPLDWAVSSEPAAENIEAAQYTAPEDLTFRSEPLASRPTTRPQRSQPQMPNSTPSQAASTVPVQRASQSALPAAQGAPAAPPQKPRTTAQMGDDERLANIMEFHRQREREQQRVHEERIQRMKAQPSANADETTTTESDSPQIPRRRRGASFEYIETSTLRSGEDDAPAASGTEQTAIQRQEREVSASSIVDDTGSAGGGESPEDLIEDADVPNYAAREPLEYAREAVTPFDASPHFPDQTVPDSPSRPFPLAQRQPDTISAHGTDRMADESPNAPVLTPSTAVAALPVQNSAASAAAAETLQAAAYFGTDEAVPDTSSVHMVHSDDLTLPDDPFAVNRAVGADVAEHVALGSPEATMRATDVPQSSNTSSVPMDLEVRGDTASAALGGNAISNETAQVATPFNEAPVSSMTVQRTVADAGGVETDSLEVLDTLGTVENPSEAPDARDFATATPAVQAEARQPQRTVQDTPSEGASQEAESVSIGDDDGTSASTSMPDSPIIAAIQRSTNADTSLSSEYVIWDQLPMFDVEPGGDMSVVPAQADEDTGAHSAIAGAVRAESQSVQTAGDVLFGQPAGSALVSAMSPSTVQPARGAMIDSLETESDSEGIYPTTATPAPAQNSMPSVTSEHRASAQERSDEQQGTATKSHAGTTTPAVNVQTAARDRGEVNVPESIRRASDSTPASVVSARYVMPQLESSPDHQGDPAAAVESLQPTPPAEATGNAPIQLDTLGGREGLSQTGTAVSPTFAADTPPIPHHQNIVQRSTIQGDPSRAATQEAPEYAAADGQEDMDEDADFDDGEYNTTQPDLYQALVTAGAITPSAAPVQRWPENSVQQAKVPDANSTEAELLKWLNLPPNTPVTGSLKSDAPASSAPNVQRALSQPSADVSPQEEQQEDSTETNADAGSVDVDKLARDVYSVLRNRLRIERERRNNK